MKRFGATYVAVLLFFALCAYFLYFRNPSPETPSLTVDSGGIPLYDATVDTVDSFLVEPDGIHMVRNADGDWAPRSEVRYRLDDSRVRMLVSLVSPLRADREVTAETDDYGQYGLEKPWRRLVVNLTDGSQRVVEFGDVTPVGTGYYARVAGVPAVYTVPEHRVAGVGWTLPDLRSPWVVDFEAAAMSRFDVHNADGLAFTFERAGEHAWTMTHPWRMPTDFGEVEDQLRQFRYLRAQEYVAEDLDAGLHAYGFDRPFARLVATMVDGTTLEVTVGQVADADGNQRMFAMNSLEPFVFAVPVAELVASDATVFIGQRLIPHIAYEVEWVTVSRGTASWGTRGPEGFSPGDTAQRVIVDRDERPDREILSALLSIMTGGRSGTDDRPPVPVGSGPYPAVEVRYKLHRDEAETVLVFVRIDVATYVCQPSGYDIALWADTETIERLADLML